MKLGEETWKWALVVLLLAVFILVAHQAYRTVNNPEDQYAPPEDYLKGDSFDQERHNPGPGAGQPIDVPDPLASGAAPVGPDEPVEHPVVDWNQLNSGAQASGPAEAPPAPGQIAPVPTPTPTPAPAPDPAPATPAPAATASPSGN